MMFIAPLDPPLKADSTGVFEQNRVISWLNIRTGDVFLINIYWEWMYWYSAKTQGHPESYLTIKEIMYESNNSPDATS